MRFFRVKVMGFFREISKENKSRNKLLNENWLLLDEVFSIFISLPILAGFIGLLILVGTPYGLYFLALNTIVLFVLIYVRYVFWALARRHGPLPTYEEKSSKAER